MKMVIDKAGRTVIPKQLRDRLGLKPGDELEAAVENGQLVARPAGMEIRLVRRNGRLVATTAQPVSPLANDDVVDFIHQLREERMDHLLHAGDPDVECHRPE